MPIIPDLHNLKINILAIDPGLNNTGIALLTTSYSTKDIESIQAYTIQPEKYIASYYLSEYLDDRTIKLLILKDLFSNIVLNNSISIIVSESPFFYGNKPAAFRALVEVINVYRQTIAEINPTIAFTQLEPLLVKKQVRSLNIHEKASTKEALELLGISKYIDLNTLDEHSIDAISIGYAFLKTREYIK